MASATTSAGAQSFLRSLAARYGNIAALQASDVSSVLTVDASSLSTSHLSSLFRHQHVALHVKNFLSPSASASFASQYSARAALEAKNWQVSTSRGLESSDVATIGTPGNVAASNPDPAEQQAYHDEVALTLASYRASPSPHPFSLLRLLLDDLSPHGCTLRKSPSSRLPYSPGLPRLTTGPTRYRSGFIHVDDLSPLDDARGTFSANVYLQQPAADAGFDGIPNPGGLRIWPLRYSKKEFYLNAPVLSALTSSDPEDQAVLRQSLEGPVDILPEAGDLVLLCVQRPHCVVGFREGQRVSLQSFLEVAEGQPCLIDS